MINSIYNNTLKNLEKELLFGIIIEKGEFLIIGKVGGGFTIEQRTSLLEGLQNLKVDSNLIEPSGSKTPFTISVIPVPLHMPPAVCATRLIGGDPKHKDGTGVIEASSGP